MAEYFEREDAVNAVMAAKWVDGSDGAMAMEIVASPPAADVVPVLRCKDCKHFKNYGKTSLLIDGKNIKAGWCHRRARFDEEYRMPPDGFCSYGERREDTDG